MSSLPTIAVVTPSFNQGRFLERTIRSVLQQVRPPSEYMVIDGGSEDDSVEILRRHGDSLRFVSEPDRGQAHAVNKGIEATSGEIIGWLNSDDVYTRDALSIVSEMFGKHPEADVIYGRADHIDQDGRVLGPYPVEPWNLTRMKRTCTFCQPAVFFRRRVVERFGGLDESLHYCLDYEYWLRLGMGGARYMPVDKTLACSRVYGQTKTHGSRPDAYRETCEMLSRVLGRTPGNWLMGYGGAVAEREGLKRTQRFRFLTRAATVACRTDRELHGPWSLNWLGGLAETVARFGCRRE